MRSTAYAGIAAVVVVVVVTVECVVFLAWMSSVSPLLRVSVLRVVEGEQSEVVVGIAQMEIAVDVGVDGGGDGVLECITDKGRGESGGGGGGGGGVIVLDADATARA